MPHAWVRGVRLYYERRGTGEPLLWLPGFTLSAAAYEPALPLYERHYECILFDNRLSGRSGAGAGLVSIPRLAGDAVGLLNALRIPAAHVYGLSYGGMVGQEMAIRFPHRVRGLMLGGTSPGGPLAVRPTLRELRALGWAVGRSAGRYPLAAVLFSPEFRARDRERARELTRYVQRHRAPLRGMALHLLASVYHDTVSRLPLIEAPTLVLHGERDAMAPLANARLLAELIPGAELAVVPGAGHGYLLEAPEESARLVLDFLARRRPQPGTRRPARTEPLSRALGLPVGAARTGRSLAVLLSGRNRDGEPGESESATP
jgi:3-oxoadipate enol-lactonase